MTLGVLPQPALRSTLGLPPAAAPPPPTALPPLPAVPSDEEPPIDAPPVLAPAALPPLDAPAFAVLPPLPEVAPAIDVLPPLPLPAMLDEPLTAGGPPLEAVPAPAEPLFGGVDSLLHASAAMVKPTTTAAPSRARRTVGDVNRKMTRAASNNAREAP